MAKGLAHKQIVDDSSLCDSAGADQLLIFRKKGDNETPITQPTGLHSYAGSRQMPNDILQWKGHDGKQTENRYSHWIWRNYASAFWDDVRIGRVLPYKESKEQDDENRRKKEGEEALGLMTQMGQGRVTSSLPAEIDYMYDISGDSVFATPKQESLMPSPFEETPEAAEGARPRYQYYSPTGGYLYAEGGLIDSDDLQTIDDLYEMLRSK
jgi:hypothetical protein